jgi:histidine ammonia-lyase
VATWPRWPCFFSRCSGLGEVNFEGKKQPSKSVLEKFGWQPLTLEAKEGLALLNGTHFMAAHGVYM